MIHHQGLKHHATGGDPLLRYVVAALDVVPHGVVIADAGAEVLWANRRARELAAREDGFAFASSRITGTPELHEAIRRAATRGARANAGTEQFVVIARSEQSACYRLAVVRSSPAHSHRVSSVPRLCSLPMLKPECH